MSRKILAILLILIGLSIISYPTLRDEYYEYQQGKITEQWLAGLEHINNEVLRGEDTSNTQTTPPLDLTKEMEALLIIDKINLEVPILTGITQRNLNLAVASVEDTGKPGEIGNYCIAGHRSRSYGKLFSRINELALGDRIVVQAKDNTYVYRVTESMIVQPEEVKVLRPEGQKKQISLITCDYRTKPYLRLIVKGELELR
jgi:sortase A